ncbi:Cas4 family exonuclease [Mycobacterium phage Amohnition]|uniref:Cas4 family exonuclease n=1 Tax=Mycobacterium phage Amohnition TaxID=2015874 RepID=A0A222ZQR6_9CAUD|nr:exonuclease [Mycobacterium phage Amohnition]ASR86340.1 Cas4 family exonuclease [Mycobacterium phage Amohnition]
MSGNAGFFGLTDDAPERDRPPTTEQEFNAALLGDLKGVFKRAWSTHARSQQRALGPSEVGHPCTRRLVTATLEYPRINPEGDPLPAWLGTAGHSKYEDAIELDNQRIIDEWLKDREQRCTVLREVVDEPQYVGRWFSERRVQVSGGLAGTCDLYDTWTDTVIDLKFPGATAFSTYKKQGPSPEYKVQAHCYGRGYRNEGFPVKRVAIWFIPRGGTLSASFVWSEAFDDAVVDETVERLQNIALVLNDLDIEAHPERLALVPKTPHNCMFCPFFVTKPDERPWACEGGAK